MSVYAVVPMVLVGVGVIPGLSRASCQLCSGGTHFLKLLENIAVIPGAVLSGRDSFSPSVSHGHYFISLGAWSCGSGMTFSSFSWLSTALGSSDAVQVLGR